MLLFMALVLVVGINFIFFTVRQCQKLYVIACINAEYLIQVLSIHLLEYTSIIDDIIPEFLKNRPVNSHVLFAISLLLLYNFFAIVIMYFKDLLSYLHTQIYNYLFKEKSD